MAATPMLARTSQRPRVAQPQPQARKKQRQQQPTQRRQHPHCFPSLADCSGASGTRRGHRVEDEAAQARVQRHTGSSVEQQPKRRRPAPPASRCDASPNSPSPRPRAGTRGRRAAPPARSSDRATAAARADKPGNDPCRTPGRRRPWRKPRPLRQRSGIHSKFNATFITAATQVSSSTVIVRLSQQQAVAADVRAAASPQTSYPARRTPGPKPPCPRRRASAMARHCPTAQIATPTPTQAYVAGSSMRAFNARTSPPRRCREARLPRGRTRP